MDGLLNDPQVEYVLPDRLAQPGDVSKVFRVSHQVSEKQTTDIEWTKKAGSLSLTNNSVVATGATSSVLTVNGILAADVSVSAVINTSTSPAVGLVARYTGAGDNGMYYGTIARNAAEYIGRIWKNVNNTWIQIASQTTASGTGVLRFDVIGSNLSLWLNNQQVVSVVDTSTTGPGTAGIRFSGVGGIVDSFTASVLLAHVLCF